MTIEFLIFLVLVLIISIVIHEVSHGYMAYFLGDPTAKLAGRLTLNPFKHLDPVGSVLVPIVLIALGGFVFGWAKPVPYNPHNLRPRHGGAYVAAAGPLSNLLVALIFGLVLRAGLLAGADIFFQLVVYLNVILAVFNLIPVVPLDGSKILFALLPLRWRHIEEFLLRFQLVFLFLLIIVILKTGLLGGTVSFLFRLFAGTDLSL